MNIIIIYSIYIHQQQSYYMHVHVAFYAQAISMIISALCYSAVTK